jgi:segregation and condensation protein A
MLHVPQPHGQPHALTLALGRFEGPLDLLLDLARRQKVDLAEISIVALVDQYLAFIAAAQPRLEVAADYLVMAAWLAYLKSRLLLPDDPEPEPEAAEQAAALKHRLARLEAMREAAKALDARPRLGRDVFQRAAPEGLTVTLHRRAVADFTQLIAAYGAVRARIAARGYQPRPRAILSIEAARQRLVELMGEMPAWSELSAFLPPELSGVLLRGAQASLLVAALELARLGRATLRQRAAFGPIELRAA